MTCSAKEAVIKARQEVHNLYKAKDVYDFGDMWHVIWSYPTPISGGTPSYLVDKKTGATMPFEPELTDEHFAIAKKYYDAAPIDRSLWE